MKQEDIFIQLQNLLNKYKANFYKYKQIEFDKNAFQAGSIVLPKQQFVMINTYKQYVDDETVELYISNNTRDTNRDLYYQGN